jgi:16S rRNA (adenine1518-N6/adenine1519-N6)-dimethyltransferase
VNAKKHLKNNSSYFPFSPQKKLGQNFLLSPSYLQKIMVYCPINLNTIIIEIGSGYGNLTNLLATSNCQKLVGLEKDKQLFQ